MADQSEFKPNNDLGQYSGCLMIVVLLVILTAVISAFIRDDKPDEFDASDAISACKSHYINEGLKIQIFEGDRADVKSYGWFVVITTKFDGYRRCKVSKSGIVYDTN